jgi:hypothetical protein
MTGSHFVKVMEHAGILVLGVIPMAVQFPVIELEVMQMEWPLSQVVDLPMILA